MHKSILSLPKALFLLSVASGCAVSELAGIGSIKTEVSQFDNSKQITLGPAFLTGGSIMNSPPVKLGAHFNSNEPDSVWLVAKYDGMGPSYVNIHELSVKIGEKVKTFKSGGLTEHESGGYNSLTKSIPTSSSNSFKVPVSYLKEMIAAKDCRLRIGTGKGDITALFHIEKSTGQMWAKGYLKRFLAKIEGSLK